MPSPISTPSGPFMLEKTIRTKESESHDEQPETLPRALPCLLRICDAGAVGNICGACPTDKARRLLVGEQLRKFQTRLHYWVCDRYDLCRRRPGLQLHRSQEWWHTAGKSQRGSTEGLFRNARVGDPGLRAHSDGSICGRHGPVLQRFPKLKHQY